MEAKSGSRSNKKSGSGGPSTAGDRRKAKSRKTKDKRKPSLKGTESTDIPSPELDSEVPQEGDATLTDLGDGQTTPVGQVTKLPHLASQSSVSLTTQVHPKAAAGPRSTASTKTSQFAGQHNSAPTTRTALSTTAIVTTTTTSSASAVDGVVARVANLNIKHRSSTGNKPRSKTQASKSRSSRVRDRHHNHPSGTTHSTATGGSATSTKTLPQPVSCLNESLRWEYILDDVEKERERIALYKMNRRKRYLAAAQAKGLRWAMNYNSQTNVSPLSEDSGVETACGSPGSYVDFGTMQSLRPIPAHRGLQEAFVEC